MGVTKYRSYGGCYTLDDDYETPDSQEYLTDSGDESEEVVIPRRPPPIRMSREQHGSSMASARIKEAKIIDPNNGRCLITNEADSSGTIEPCHLIRAPDSETVDIIDILFATHY